MVRKKNARQETSNGEHANGAVHLALSRMWIVVFPSLVRPCPRGLVSLCARRCPFYWILGGLSRSSEGPKKSKNDADSEDTIRDAAQASENSNPVSLPSENLFIYNNSNLL